MKARMIFNCSTGEDDETDDFLDAFYGNQYRRSCDEVLDFIRKSLKYGSPSKEKIETLEEIRNILLSCMPPREDR